MFTRDILFRVPIYRESEKAYYEYLTEQRDRMVENAPGEANRQWLRENPPPINLERISWEYNRIIGWIVFYADGRLIKADLWFTRAKRVRKKIGRVIFDYTYKIGDVTSSYDPDNELIRSEIREFLDDLQQGESGYKFDRFYIDSELLLRNLEYMDIRKLLDDLLEKHLKKSNA